MEIENQFGEYDGGVDHTRGSLIRPRSKTSLRLKYEAETQVLKRDLGSLEDIRIRLGFSRRKMCQLLLVDPSAWSRWTAKETDAPPHIYRALQWYLDSKRYQSDKYETYWEDLKNENRKLHSELARIKTQVLATKTLFYCLCVSSLALVAVLIWKLSPLKI